MSDPAVDNRSVRVNDREQLIFLLSEAAEIEHGLMCSYLYAAWSLKQSQEEGLSDSQLAAVNRWRSIITGVAMEEMLHLALVSNLLMSLGSPPHFSRPNFPIPVGYHPSSIVARLTPFTRETADHFVYLERPEGVFLPQVAGFESVDYERREPVVRLTPTAEDFDTVSHLYRGIEDGFRLLAERLGETKLFVGDPACQLDPSMLTFDGLIAVTDLDSAIAAISIIVEQGEGGRHDGEKSHFSHFRKVRDDYDTFLAQDTGFRPYRDVVSDPLMFSPIDGDPHRHISGEAASKVLDIANAAYGLMLRLLASGFSLSSTPDDRTLIEDKRTEIESAIAVMGIVKSLAIQLTKLPANDGTEKAGMTFHLPRSTLALPDRSSGKALLAERAREIAATLESLTQVIPELNQGLARRLESVAAALTCRIAS
ncbi:ferritin-like domain-containing protein [Noviherbaspirillum malthae]|uniref:ferritin-like domain-containing protein n=1 Tax=Noviherbaspirillum malthae TaxID=1260987 RepID=UPI001890B307|nr:ferritin-like protein [Noviherbaspirillum malthae]